MIASDWRENPNTDSSAGFDLIGMFWLIRRGGYGIAREWHDPRAN